jgi:hypothetical protein
MLYPTPIQPITHVQAQRKRLRRSYLLCAAGLLGLTLLTGLLMLEGPLDGREFGWLIYIAGLIAIIYRPVNGIFLITGFTLVSDQFLLYWYPFVKNMSSQESIFYLHSAVFISPFEVYLGLTLLSWLSRMAAKGKYEIYTGPLFWPALAFFSCVMYAIIYGVLRGGDKVIVLWEVRPFFYLFTMFLLASNLIRKPQQVNLLLWIIAIALFIKALFGNWYVYDVLNFKLGSVERIGEHAMSIHFNSLYLMLVAAWIYRDSLKRRLFLMGIMPFVLLSYFANHRRAGFLVLAIALALFAIVLFQKFRKLFWILVPLAAVFAVIYLAIFWNSSGTLGMPANAIKSVIGQPNERDQSSNEYRDIENWNITYTIRQVPLTGLGFGNKFYINIPLPDISFFDRWEYVTHNSIMWVWMQGGVLTFYSMLLFIGNAVMLGARRIMEQSNTILSVAAVTATSSVLMHAAYTYVDMGWDGPSMIYMGMWIGMINGLQLIAAHRDPEKPLRWPWQAQAPRNGISNPWRFM